MHYDQWLTNVVPGTMLKTLHEVQLFPQNMWTQLLDEDTWNLTIPSLSAGDHILVLDVMSENLEVQDQENYTFAALVITHCGVGCVLLLRSEFTII